MPERYIDKLFPLCERLQQTALGIIDEANLVVTERGMLEPTILALTLLSRTLLNFRALVLLIKGRLVVEARILARSCFENLFLVGGLHTQGLHFVERMKEDDRAGRKGRIRFALETESIFESLPVEAQVSVKERHQEFRASKVGFLNPKVASDVGRFKETYIAYSQMSGDAAHPTITALARHWSPDLSGRIGYFDVQPKAKDDELDETLHLTCIALIGLMVTVNEMVGFTESGKKLTTLNHELKVLQAEKWGVGSIAEGMEIRTEKPLDET